MECRRPAARVRRRVQLALLTNTTSRLANDPARLGFDREFDYVFNSA
jgi:FMN phosphatase YigB (HAD superfamily)